MKDFIDSIIRLMENGGDGLYDYICNYYYLMDKTELKSALIEIIYSVYTHTTAYEEREIYADAAEALRERYERFEGSEN